MLAPWMPDAANAPCRGHRRNIENSPEIFKARLRIDMKRIQQCKIEFVYAIAHGVDCHSCERPSILVHSGRLDPRGTSIGSGQRGGVWLKVTGGASMWMWPMGLSAS